MSKILFRVKIFSHFGILGIHYFDVGTHSESFSFFQNCIHTNKRMKRQKPITGNRLHSKELRDRKREQKVDYIQRNKQTNGQKDRTESIY